MTDRESLRVLLVNRALPAHIAGGLERHVEDLAVGLAARGCAVHLLCAPLPGRERRRYASMGIQVHDVPRTRPERYTGRFLWNVGHQIAALLAQQRFDVVHAQEFAAGCWTPRSAAPLVLSVHGTITSETPLHRDIFPHLSWKERAWALRRFSRRYLYAPIWKRTLRHASRILVDSAFSERELLRLQPSWADRIRRVPLGLPQVDPAPPPRHEARKTLGWEGLQLITLGRLEWAKGHELALRALASLRLIDWHYTIVGEGSLRQHLEQLIPELGLRGRVTFIGRIDDQRKREMLSAADLFIWPERAHPAFGLVGLEALLADTPVIAYRRGAIPEVLGERGGWLVEPNTHEALSTTLEPLLSGRQQLYAAREGLRADALERFSFDRMLQAILDVYTEIRC